MNKEDNMKFEEHLKKTSEIVENWPKWKREIIGSANRGKLNNNLTCEVTSYEIVKACKIKNNEIVMGCEVYKKDDELFAFEESKMTKLRKTHNTEYAYMNCLLVPYVNDETGTEYIVNCTD